MQNTLRAQAKLKALLALDAGAKQASGEPELMSVDLLGRGDIEIGLRRKGLWPEQEATPEIDTFLYIIELLSYVAQTERDYIRQRQAEGIAAAKARGVRFGRERIPMPAGFEELAMGWRQGRV